MFNIMRLAEMPAHWSDFVGFGLHDTTTSVLKMATGFPNVLLITNLTLNDVNIIRNPTCYVCGFR